jgi:bacterioferritin-associated ferredoxin
MFVCMCRAVTLRTIRTAIEAGADSVESVERRCGAGGDCGSCHDEIADILRAACQDGTAARGRAA